MKKTLIVILAFAALTLSVSSCTKKCQCKATVNGTEYVGSTIDREDGKSCSDYNYKLTVPVIDVEAEYKCVPTF